MEKRIYQTVLWFVRLGPFLLYPLLLGNGLGFAVKMEWGKVGALDAALLNVWASLYALLWVAFLIMCVKRKHKLLIWLYAYFWIPGLILISTFFSFTKNKPMENMIFKMLGSVGLFSGLLFDVDWHPTWTLCVFVLMTVLFFPALYFLHKKSTTNR